MINTIAAKIFGTKNEREVKRLQPVLEQITALDAATKALTPARKTFERVLMKLDKQDTFSLLSLGNLYLVLARRGLCR